MKKFRIEYLLYVFIILCPFLDSLSFLFRELFPHAFLSPSTILRPIIPAILLLYVFIQDKKTRKILFGSGLFFLLYGGIHLYFFQKNVSNISYGTILSEAQYLINYTYMIYLFYLVLYFTKNRGLPYLKQSLFLMLFSYLFLLYFSILTDTSYSTYLEGMGYRGWFLSGNSLSTILVLLGGCLLPYFFQEKKTFFFLTYILLGIYLVFLVGTRTGLFGYILISGFYFFFLFLFSFVQKKKVNKRKILIILIFLFLFGSVFFITGSSFLERRKHLKEEEVGIIDINTQENGHTSGDTSLFVYQIRNHIVTEDDMSLDKQRAYLDMYSFANQHQLASNNLRAQQLLYHFYLVKEQKNIGMLLFGNGYLSSYGEMILEMELPALLFNFGIFGFLLYFGPFVSVFLLLIKHMIKSKHFSLDKMMYIFCILLGLALSFLAGYVFFSVSCVLVFICLFSLLYKEENV